jgi:hypothetical protein
MSNIPGANADTLRKKGKGKHAKKHPEANLAWGNRDALICATATRRPTSRAAAASKPLPVLCGPDAMQSTTDMQVRHMAREFPIYSRPFIGCKVANIQLGSTAVSWSGTTWNLATTVTQGSGDQQRTGDVVRLIGVHGRFRVSKGTAVAPGSDSEYQIQVCYSPLASLPVGSVYQDVGNAYSGLSPEDWDFAAVIKRLHRTHGTVDTYNPLRVHSCMVSCNELINYDSGSTTVSTGSLIVAAISNEDPAAPTQVPAIYGNVQIFYQDV